MCSDTSQTEKTLREPNKIWHKGRHEGKKGKSKNANTPLQRVKMVIFLAPKSL
jgi:hypothetical protein